MEVLITGNGVKINSVLKAYIQRRINFALSRFSNKVGRIRVVVSKKRGPEGGIEKLCRIHVQLLGNTTLAVSHSDNDFHSAITHAADQIHRVVDRRIKFSRTFSVKERFDKDTRRGIESK
jgi:ribosomal subunit interface protein